MKRRELPSQNFELSGGAQFCFTVSRPGWAAYRSGLLRHPGAPKEKRRGKITPSSIAPALLTGRLVRDAPQMAEGLHRVPSERHFHFLTKGWPESHSKSDCRRAPVTSEISTSRDQLQIPVEKSRPGGDEPIPEEGAEGWQTQGDDGVLLAGGGNVRTYWSSEVGSRDGRGGLRGRRVPYLR